MSKKKKVGAPSTKFIPEVVNELILRMSNGETARSVCRDPRMPEWSTLVGWLQDAKKKEPDPEKVEFSLRYAQARREMLDVWADQIVEIAADDSRDVLETTKSYQKKNGEVVTTTEHRSDNTPVNRDRLRIDSMKWIMCKLAPEKYGDLQRQEVTGKGGGPIQYQTLVDRPAPESAEEWQKRVTAQMQEIAKSREQLH
jgi:multidrug efflux pump subunit AcrB